MADEEFEDNTLTEDPYYPETKRVCVGKTRSGREVYSVRRLVVTLPDDADGAPTCDMSDLEDDDDKSVTDDDETDDDDDTGSLDSFIENDAESEFETEYKE
jgi:hypothetical protein